MGEDDDAGGGRHPRAEDGGSDDDSSSGRWLWIGASAGALALGVLAYLAIGWFAAEPEPSERGPEGPLVRAAEVERAGRLTVAQTGFVEPSERLALAAEVNGRVARIAENFRVGRRFAAGETLVELERARFEAELAAAEARVEGARARRDTARSNVDRQTRLDDGGFAAEARVEEVRTALASAEAELGLARSRRELARIALEDTVLVAPYDAIVSARSISLGQIVGPGTVLGALVRADRVDVTVGLLPRQRALLGPDATLIGRSVDVFAPDDSDGPGDSDAPIASGRIAAIAPTLDPVARTLELVVEIDDPFATGSVRVGELVEVRVPVPESETAEVYDIPARALKGANRVWRIAEDGTLAPLQPRIVRRDGERVQILSDALSAGDRVLLTDVATAVEGLKVRLESRSGESGAGGSGDDARGSGGNGNAAGGTPEAGGSSGNGANGAGGGDGTAEERREGEPPGDAS